MGIYCAALSSLAAQVTSLYFVFYLTFSSVGALMEAHAIVKGEPAGVRFRSGKGIDMTANPRCTLTYDKVSGQVCIKWISLVFCYYNIVYDRCFSLYILTASR